MRRNIAQELPTFLAGCLPKPSRSGRALSPTRRRSLFLTLSPPQDPPGMPASGDGSDLLVLRGTRHSDRPLFDRMTPVQWRETTAPPDALVHPQQCPRQCAVWYGHAFAPPGHVLPSVSRRDPRRRRPQIWTSGNRIFASRRPEPVLAAAMYCIAAASTSSGRRDANMRFPEVQICALRRRGSRRLTEGRRRPAGANASRGQTAHCRGHCCG